MLVGVAPEPNGDAPRPVPELGVGVGVLPLPLLPALVFPLSIDEEEVAGGN